MTFRSVLADIGTGIKKFFTTDLAAATKVAQAIEPVVDVALPGISTLYNKTVAVAIQAESLAIAAGQQSGTGVQKLAFVVSGIETDFNTYWTGIGNTVPAPLTTIEDWVNTVVAGLNAIPAKVA